ncbi:NAD(P)H-dependent oxidoreductase [Clostridium puniceum]|uniref:NAD(P)H-dependent oxidoreductase n=1 Tax=Clostridium puniceum TaxID=29367 RepID=UPI001300E4B8|nr:NAD(P)H-dependent oxidoreductase [Clostridium puniceum]
MNIAIIYGTTRKACTYNCVQMLLNSLRLTIRINVKEFFLEKDFPNYSDKFFSCFINNEVTYPNSNSIEYLTKSLNNSDLIILACPVIQCNMTTELKSLLEHLFYKSIEYNTKSIMNNKIGLVISTTSGAGLSYITNNLKKNLIFWGIHNVFRFSKTLYEMNWEDVDLKTKFKINKKIFKLSNKILNIYLNSSYNKTISYKYQSIFKNKYNNIIDVNFHKKRTYTHDIRNIH